MGMQLLTVSVMFWWIYVIYCQSFGDYEFFQNNKPVCIGISHYYEISLQKLFLGLMVWGLKLVQTPILWSHGMADRTVLFEAGQAGPPFLEQAGVSCEFKVCILHIFLIFCCIYIWLLQKFIIYDSVGLSWSWPFNKQWGAAVPWIMDQDSSTEFVIEVWLS